MHFIFRLEEYCIAEFESEWYRGKVVEVLDEDKFLIAYIDFTNECELTSASIRRYPMSLTIPCCTNLCAIDGGYFNFFFVYCNYIKCRCFCRSSPRVK